MSVTINKVGVETPVPTGPPPAPETAPILAAARTFPRGILRKTHRRKPAKIVGDVNPARPPPTRRRKLRLTTTRSAEEIHKSMHKKAEHLPLKTIRKKLVEKGLVRPERKVAPSILRTLYAESVGAGLLTE